MELQADGARVDLLPQAVHAASVTFAQEAKVHRVAVGGLEHARQVPRAWSTGRRVGAGAGPVPPPIIVVMPEVMASRNLLRSDEVHVRVDAAGREDEGFSPAITSVPTPMTSSGSTSSMMSGSPVLPMARIRPSLMPTSALDDAPMIDNQGVGDDPGRGHPWRLPTGPMPSRMVLPPPNLDLVAVSACGPPRLRR